MKWLIVLLLTGNLMAQSMAGVQARQKIRVTMVGEGPLCEGTIESVSGAGLSIRLKSDTVECGARGSVARIGKESIYAMTVERHLTLGRVALKLLAGAGAIAALAAVPLTSSDPESWMLLGNGVIPAFVGFGGSLLVPDAKRHVLLITCPDRFDCFADSAVPGGTPAPPDEK